jgi:hypothetical protein
VKTTITTTTTTATTKDMSEKYKCKTTLANICYYDYFFPEKKLYNKRRKIVFILLPILLFLK